MLLALFVFFSLAAFDSAQPVDDYAVSSPYWTAPVVESSDFPAAPIFFTYAICGISLPQALRSKQ
jgi:hypothetical protein